jgi:hypothetical protein
MVARICWALNGPFNPLMRPCLAGIAALAALVEAAGSQPALHAHSIKAAARFAANMVRKKFPWAFYRSNKVKLAGRGFVPKYADRHRGGTYES